MMVVTSRLVGLHGNCQGFATHYLGMLELASVHHLPTLHIRAILSISMKRVNLRETQDLPLQPCENLCSMDTSIMEPYRVRNVSNTRVGHTCHLYF